MPTSSLSSVNDLVAVIRSQLAASGRSAPAAGRPGSTRKRGVAAGKYAEENLAGLIETRVRAIGADDPLRGRKAFRIFLEAVLLSHFGEALVNNARFHQIVTDVQDAMEADGHCRVLIDRAVAHLLPADDTGKR
jgi:hypothetical protein